MSSSSLLKRCLDELFPSVVVIMLIASFLASCGGRDEGNKVGGAQAFDPTNADALAHAALLKAVDLPGVGWTATDDHFDEDPNVLTPCEPLNTLREDARLGAAGRATRELARSGSNFGPYVHSEIYIY